ncbi:hypothetical protein SPRG_12083 [Saprolegnia parasitica CBS 223.65]|uniref:DUF2723 domain-containing protein n=1 Tax=Saprolegnia parasitica (strain CBS 223.65) TaxID=695850 RepID=A0A067C6C1_SAPPC|nr:hypothetical protein SPRG_12083 [Saprolegnia parasitica CBS 223.65]KDO22096.1 hypothetical protein SPRG_12083 [Saprolegnia parasitica CBS 223.65]|eukprot:XP_012207238.1 hypothetical protein SPRG_12083 [Saprolegnia parasitica CBS 223.65]
MAKLGSNVGVRDLWPAAATVAVALPIYVATAFPSVAGGDSGELVAEACIAGGGVAHPPGYPLYLLLLRAVLDQKWLELPPAYTANVLNATYAALAAGCIAHFVYLYSNKTHGLAAIAAGLMYAFAPLTWEYAVGAEVFALNNLLCGLLFVLCAIFRRTQSPWVAALGALVCGLAMSNQHTAILFEIPMVLWVLWHGRCVFRFYHIVLFAALFLAGLTPYLHMMEVASTPRKGSWGNASSWMGLLRHLVREEYGTFKLSPVKTNLTETPIERMLVYLHDAREQFIGIGFILALYGLWRFDPADMERRENDAAPIEAALGSAPEQKALDDLLLLCLLHYVVCFHALSNLPLYLPLPRAIHSRFWMQPNLVIAIFLGLGLARMHASLNAKVFAFLARAGAVVSALGLIYMQLSAQYPTANHAKKGNVIAAYGNALLDTLPPNAILLSYTDINWNSVRYLQECEQKRPDVMHLNFQLMPYHWFQRQHALYPGVTFPQLLQGVSTERGSKGFEQLMRRFVMQNMYTFPTSMYLDLHAVNESALGKDGYYNGFYVTPHGMLWKIHEQKKMPSISKWNKDVKQVWKMYNTTFPLANAAQYPSGSWEFVARKIYYDGLYQRALHHLQHWVETSAKLGKDTTFDEIDDYLFGMRDIVHALDGIYHIAMPIYCISYPKKASSRTSR